jgi:hypothetical protein
MRRTDPATAIPATAPMERVMPLALALALLLLLLELALALL